MTAEEYAAQQAVIAAAVAAYVASFAQMFRIPVLSPTKWIELLQFLFPEVQRQYTASAELGRVFYDAQRVIHLPGLDRNERLRSEIEFEWFVRSMEPARRGMSQAESPQSAVTNFALSATREVEMAARRQIIGAVENDPVRDQTVVGWARVATGRETCAWCLMLISRGADRVGSFYKGANTAGLNLSDTTAEDLYREAGGDLEKFREETKPYINQWHAGCDCLVVPVFDVMNWPGREQANRALTLWIEAGKEASRLIRNGKARTDNQNLETQNALRRTLYKGVNMSAYALAA